MMASFVPRTALWAQASLAENIASASVTQSCHKDENPSELVRDVSREFLDDLSAHRAEYKKDPGQLRAAVDRDVLPFFDMQRAARLVLGVHWRDAGADQRRRFVDAFEGSMLANYGNAVVDFRSDRLKIFPDHVQPGARYSAVRTEATENDGSTVSVIYAMRRNAAGCWLAWDVIIDGISYVKSFHDDLGEEVEQQGLDATIARMQRVAHGKQAARG
jgi:phospholipid transport system substrate-binding protein